MKCRLTIDFDLGSEMSAQLLRTGCVVYKNGSAFRVRIGNNVVANDRLIINLEELKDEPASFDKPSGVSG